MTGIYGIENTVTGKWYIGKAVDIQERWWVHLHKLRHGTHHSSKLQNSYKKHGEAAFAFRVLEECQPEELNAKEVAWILKKDSYCAGYNMTTGGEGGPGVVFTDEMRAKRSGPGNSFYGKKHTEASRAKMRAAHHGKTRGPLSEETRRKISAAHTGMKHTEEAKQKLRDLYKGKKPSAALLAGAHRYATSPDNKLAKAVICIETGIVYFSAAEAARRTGLDRSKISAVCRGDRKSTNGTHWRFADGGGAVNE